MITTLDMANDLLRAANRAPEQVAAWNREEMDADQKDRRLDRGTDEAGVLTWAEPQFGLRGQVTTLRALRRTWLPLWSVNEDDLGRNIRRAARCVNGGAGMNGPRPSRWF